MQNAAVGFRVHSGWAAAVAVCGPLDELFVADRRKILLVQEFSYAYRQPYHTAENMPRKDGTRFIDHVQSDAKRLARSSLRTLKKELAARNCKIVCSALLLASSCTLPELDRILASHALIHAADGELFRDSLQAACTLCSLPMEGIREKELLATASKELGVEVDALQRRLIALGKGLGPPWSHDEKFAALGAWLTLARQAIL
jgi:hypothetical protein